MDTKVKCSNGTFVGKKTDRSANSYGREIRREGSLHILSKYLGEIVGRQAHCRGYLSFAYLLGRMFRDVV